MYQSLKDQCNSPNGRIKEKKISSFNRWIKNYFRTFKISWLFILKRCKVEGSFLNLIKDTNVAISTISRCGKQNKKGKHICMLSYVGVDVVIVKIVYSLAFGHGQGGQESSRSKGFIWSAYYRTENWISRRSPRRGSS